MGGGGGGRKEERKEGDDNKSPKLKVMCASVPVSSISLAISEESLGESLADITELLPDRCCCW